MIPASVSRRFGQLFKFGLTSVASFVVNVGGTWLLTEALGLPPEVSYALALVAVFCMNFFLMRLWVFPEGKSVSALRQARAFLFVTIAFRIAEYGSFFILHTLGKLDYLWSIIAISIVATGLKFFTNRLLFSQQSNRAKQTTRKRRSAVLLGVTAVVAIGMSLFKFGPAIVHANEFHEDLGQHAFWAQRAWGGNPTEYSEVARYFASEAAAPIGYHWIMRGLGLLGDVQAAGDVLNVALAAAMAVWLAVLCGKIARSRWVMPIIAIVFFAIFPNQRLIEDSFLQRTFAVPLLLMCMWGLHHRQMAWVGLSMIGCVLLYPITLATVGAIAVTHELFMLARTRRMPPGWIAGLVLGLVAARLLSLRHVPEQFGPMVTYEQAKSMPIFSNEGRSSIFLENRYRYWFTGSRTSIGFTPQQLLLGVGTLLAAGFLAKWRRIPPLVWTIIGVSLALFFAAHATLFDLYLPNRHTRITLPLAWFMLLAIALAGGWTRLRVALRRQWRGSTSAERRFKFHRVAGGALVLALALAIYDGGSRTLVKLTDWEPQSEIRIHDWLRHTPPGTLVAGMPDDISRLTLQTGRPTLITRESTQAYYLGFYNDIVLPRLRDTNNAFYATDWETVDELYEKYGVRVFYFRAHNYQRLPYEEPFRTLARIPASKLDGKVPVMYDPPIDRVLYQAADMYLIRVGPPFAKGEVPPQQPEPLPTVPSFFEVYDVMSPPKIPPHQFETMWGRPGVWGEALPLEPIENSPLYRPDIDGNVPTSMPTQHPATQPR